MAQSVNNTGIGGYLGLATNFLLPRLTASDAGVGLSASIEAAQIIKSAHPFENGEGGALSALVAREAMIPSASQEAPKFSADAGEIEGRLGVMTGTAAASLRREYTLPQASSIAPNVRRGELEGSITSTGVQIVSRDRYLPVDGAGVTGGCGCTHGSNSDARASAESMFARLQR